MSAPHDISCVQNTGIMPVHDTLSPILPTSIRDSRYQSDIRVKLTATIIPLGTHFCSAPSYQSKGWTVSVHPEGKSYAHNQTEAGFSIVTEAHVSQPGVAAQLDNALAMIRARAAEKDVHLPDSSDLFLEIDSNAGTCSYWFADHANRTIFWLHQLDTREVGMPNSYSKNHLQYSLEENYWTHVEMFPTTASQYAMTALNELQIILLHARADALTSDLPTFPYTAEENEKFINLLQSCKEHASNPYVTTFVARLWEIVANHRFFTHFGEGHCRLSAVHSVLEAPARKRSLILTVISKALFDLPNEHRGNLESLWVDDLVYRSRWNKFVSDRVEDLKQKMIWLFALMIANILIIPISYCPALNKCSILLSILGLWIALVLFQEQHKLVGTASAVGAAYLDTHNTSHGFQSTAIVHSLPLAAFVWAFFLFMIQGFWMTFGNLPTVVLLPIVIPVAVVMAVACFGIWLALNPRGKPFEEDTSAAVPLETLQTFTNGQKDTPAVGSMV